MQQDRTGRPFREHYSLVGDLAKGWSSWHKGAVPWELQVYEPRGPDQSGFRIKNVNVPNGEACGIYEWRAVNDRQNVVVYVGSTCRAEGRPLEDRIQEYLLNGSHLEEHFNEALDRDYEMEFRTKPARGLRQARAMENELLEEYNYAWNMRQNAPQRDIL